MGPQACQRRESDYFPRSLLPHELLTAQKFDPPRGRDPLQDPLKSDVRRNRCKQLQFFLGVDGDRLTWKPQSFLCPSSLDLDALEYALFGLCPVKPILYYSFIPEQKVRTFTFLLGALRPCSLSFCRPTSASLLRSAHRCRSGVLEGYRRRVHVLNVYFRGSVECSLEVDGIPAHQSKRMFCAILANASHRHVFHQ